MESIEICFKGNKFKIIFNLHIIDYLSNLTLLNTISDKKPEITIDFSKNKTGLMNVNLHFNKTLSDERKKLESLGNPYSSNIIY